MRRQGGPPIEDRCDPVGRLSASFVDSLTRMPTSSQCHVGRSPLTSGGSFLWLRVFFDFSPLLFYFFLFFGIFLDRNRQPSITLCWWAGLSVSHSNQREGRLSGIPDERPPS